MDLSRHVSLALVTAILVLGVVGATTVQASPMGRQTTSGSSTTTEAKKADAATPLPGSMEKASHDDDASKSKTGDASATSSDQAALVRWYGHAFIYIINSTGVRVAMDPFARNTVKYLFPPRLPADTVLISTEADDHAAGELLFGTPQIFRSYTAIGLNKANGLIFKGISVNRDGRGGPNSAKCTAFVFTLDGVTFAHLGVLGDILDARQRQDIGRVDVVFLPVGNPLLNAADLTRIATDLQAKIIVPITYRTDMTPGMNLRSLEDYLREQKFPVKRLDKSEFPINPSLLPNQPTIYVPALP